ncbi:MAG: polyphosphate kinase 1 [Burkholderiales bacterium]|nr:polyphosphate kinase 1 [Burkholderiales bacterium]
MSEEKIQNQTPEPTPEPSVKTSAETPAKEVSKRSATKAVTAKSTALVNRTEPKKTTETAKTPETHKKTEASKKAAAKTVESVVKKIKPISLNDPSLYTNRELSWIEFDRKVLETAEDETIPLLSRISFLSIFYNNLDEFFMVRVMNVQKQARSGVEATGPDKLPPAKQMQEIRSRVTGLLEEAEELWLKNLNPALKEHGITISSYESLNNMQQAELNKYFDKNVFPILTPQGVDAGRPFPVISNLSINFVIILEDATKENGKTRYARLKCPNNVPRFLFVSDRDFKVTSNLSEPNVSDGVIIMMEDLVRNRLETLFPGYRVKASGLFRITRNTDGEIEEDEADDLLSAIRDFVDQRRFGSVVRLEIEKGMPQKLQDFLVKHLEVDESQIYYSKVPLAFSEFMRLTKIDKSSLKYPPLHQKLPKQFDSDRNIFDEIKKRDLMVYHPYDSFNCVLDFLRQASIDPDVVAIKQTLYRCGSDSPVAKLLLEARRLGKQVTAVVELKARFDEEQNITWAEEMERNGVNVVYGFAGLKIHAKLCFVVRKEGSKIVRYAHIGTGNYNASSAKIYTDYGLFTANKEICDDIQQLFNVMTGFSNVKNYQALLVSPKSLRGKIVDHIRKEVEMHRQYGNGHIIIKCNQLIDADMVKELYEASRAGVRIQCIVRGICGLRPGIPTVSETITVRSIVGKLLEHARLYYFHNNGDPEIYVGSADLMTRNLNGRIEVLTPIFSPVLKQNLMEQVIEPQLKDNFHAWILESDGMYEKLTPKPGEKVYDSQEEIAKDLNLLKVKKAKKQPQPA